MNKEEENKQESRKCPECNGRGLISNQRCDHNIPCWRCKGSGKFREVTQKELYG